MWTVVAPQHAVLGAYDDVFDPRAMGARPVHTWLDTEGHPGLQDPLVPRDDVGLLMGFEPDAVPSAMDEQFAEVRLRENLTGNRIDRLTRHSGPHSLDRRSLRSLALIPLVRQDFRIVVGSAREDGPWHPATPLLWELALWAARGRIPFGVPFDAPVRLLRWPNLTRLALTPDAIRIAGLWSGHPTSLLLSARALQVPQRHVFAFFSACRALDLLRLEDAPKNLPASAQPHPSRESASRGLFDRILDKLPGRTSGDAQP